MNFQDAENTYRGLKQQHAAGKLTDEEFEAQVTQLWCQDAQGHWWLIGAETGEWYMLDGEKWIKAQPPLAPVKAPATAEAPRASTPAPPPTGTSPAVEGGTAVQVKSGTVPSARRENVPPVGKGPSTLAVLGLIAVVAFVVILIVVSGYLIISSVLGGSVTARATTTPTRSLALIPTLTSEVPTDTPMPPPTSEATATEEGTPTRALAKATATKKPASPTPSGPTATATLNVPPGVYVTNVETVPSQVNLGDPPIGFKVTFLNTTGSIQTYNWYVKWYQCPDECQDFKHSHGETLLMNSNLPTGTSALTTSQNISLRPGISCDLMAVANFIDPVNQMPTPFQATRNSGHFAFTPCH